MPLDFDKVTSTPLVPLTLAKTHLRVTDTAHDADIDSKRAQATNIILDYLKAGADATWTELTVPLPVQAAILLMLTHLYEHRGDDMLPAMQSGATSDDAVWSSIDRLLVRYRDPAIA